MPKLCVLPHLVVKVCFCSSLWSQAKFAIGHFLRVVPETSHSQYQHTSYHCYGDKGDDRPTGALGNSAKLRMAPCIGSLGKK